MYVSVVFVIRCLYSTVSLTLIREQRFIRIIYYYYYWFSTDLVEAGGDTVKPLTVALVPAKRRHELKTAFVRVSDGTEHL